MHDTSLIEGGILLSTTIRIASTYELQQQQMDEYLERTLLQSMYRYMYAWWVNNFTVAGI